MKRSRYFEKRCGRSQWIMTDNQQSRDQCRGWGCSKQFVTGTGSQQCQTKCVSLIISVANWLGNQHFGAPAIIDSQPIRTNIASLYIYFTQNNLDAIVVTHPVASFCHHLPRVKICGCVYVFVYDARWCTRACENVSVDNPFKSAPFPPPLPMFLRFGSLNSSLSQFPFTIISFVRFAFQVQCYTIPFQWRVMSHHTPPIGRPVPCVPICAGVCVCVCNVWSVV